MLRLFHDWRLNPERLYVAEMEEPMQVPEIVHDCVLFLYGQVNGRKVAFGTAFFVGIADSECAEPMAWRYVVTAKHVIEKIKEDGANKIVYFRLNRRNGGIDFIETKAKDWKSHPIDSFIDVAVLSWAPDRNLYKVVSVLDSVFITENKIAIESIGTGEEVFITGLFSERIGLKRNIPIVRVGTIAAMPSEPISVEISGAKGEMPAYLIEARSLGGLSGSPVFVNLGTFRLRDGQPQAARGPVFYLIGLIHGHYDEPFSRKIGALTDKVINMGIAVVVPMQQIREVLDQPIFLNQRIEDKEKYMKARTPTQDVSQLARVVVEAAIGEPLTKAKKAKKTAKKAPARAK